MQRNAFNLLVFWTICSCYWALVAIIIFWNCHIALVLVFMILICAYMTFWNEDFWQTTLDVWNNVSFTVRTKCANRFLHSSSSNIFDLLRRQFDQIRSKIANWNRMEIEWLFRIANKIEPLNLTCMAYGCAVGISTNCKRFCVCILYRFTIKSAVTVSRNFCCSPPQSRVYLLFSLVSFDFVSFYFHYSVKHRAQA